MPRAYSRYISDCTDITQVLRADDIFTICVALTGIIRVKTIQTNRYQHEEKKHKRIGAPSSILYGMRPKPGRQRGLIDFTSTNFFEGDHFFFCRGADIPAIQY